MSNDRNEERTLQARTATARSPAPPGWYQDLRRRIRKTVLSVIPANATAMVVSRGDDELLDLDGREAWHFPRLPDGRYAGYHPAGSAAAIEHLEALREKGADYLILPHTARWWLQYYVDFADHLKESYSMVADYEATCTIYSLLPESAWKAPECPSDVGAHFQEFLDGLLPGVSVAIVRGGENRIRLKGRSTVEFPTTDPAGDTAAALSDLHELTERGIEFIVIPHVVPSWLDEHPGFLAALERDYRLVARQQHVCTVYELSRDGPATQASLSG
jgi:hypothetical protein